MDSPTSSISGDSVIIVGEVAALIDDLSLPEEQVEEEEIAGPSQPSLAPHTRQELHDLAIKHKDELLRMGLEALGGAGLLKDVNLKQIQTIDDVRFMIQVTALFEGGFVVRVFVTSIRGHISNADNNAPHPRPSQTYVASTYFDHADFGSAGTALTEAVELLPKFIYGSKADPVSASSEVFFAKRFIVPNDQRVKRFDTFSLYCRLCELHVRSPNLFVDHIRGTDHKLFTQRYRSRNFLLNFWSKHPPFAFAQKRQFYETIQQRTLESLDFHYKKYNPSVLNDYFLKRQNAVPGYTIRFMFFGSYASFLSCGASPIDCYVVIQRVDGADVPFSEKFQVLRQLVTKLRPFETCFSGWLATFDGLPGNFFLTMDQRAWTAVLSARLLALYVQSCPGYAMLALMFRTWAHHSGFLQKNSADSWVSGAIFDYMALHFMQQQYCFPIINDHTVGAPLENFLQMSLEAQMQRVAPMFVDYDKNYKPPPTLISFTTLVMFYGCGFDFSSCVQITSLAKVYKEQLGLRSLKVLEPLSQVNILAVRMETILHLENCLFFGSADILQPVSNFNATEHVTVDFLSTNSKDARNGNPNSAAWRLPYLVLQCCADKSPAAVNRRVPINIPYNGGLTLWSRKIVKEPQPYCNACHKVMHTERECRRLLRVDLDQSPIKVAKLGRFLTHSLKRHYEKEKIEQRYLDEALVFVHEMEVKVATRLNFDIKFNPFGSLVSGFGTKGSDYDLCISLPDGVAQTVTEDKITELLSSIADVFVEDGFAVAKIFSAKVPIITFRGARNGQVFKGDISYANELALKNTELLATYARFDGRVAPLGIAVKKWANVVGINNAANHTLSSYALTVMVIHYLQRGVSPPVLPFLQDSNAFRIDDSMIIDGFEVKFAKPSEEFIQDFRRNTLSLGDLFIGFFEYFDKFDWRYDVVNIRFPGQLMKIEKGWTRSFLAIEDPFELTHNLSAGVRELNGLYILKCINLMRAQFREADCIFASKDFDFKTIDDSAVDKLKPQCSQDRNFANVNLCFTCKQPGHSKAQCPQRARPPAAAPVT